MCRWPHFVSSWVFIGGDGMYACASSRVVLHQEYANFIGGSRRKNWAACVKNAVDMSKLASVDAQDSHMERWCAT